MQERIESIKERRVAGGSLKWDLHEKQVHGH